MNINKDLGNIIYFKLKLVRLNFKIKVDILKYITMYKNMKYKL